MEINIISYTITEVLIKLAFNQMALVIESNFIINFIKSDFS